MGKHKSFRSKAVHFVTDLTAGLLNPISDKPSSARPLPVPKFSSFCVFVLTQSNYYSKKGFLWIKVFIFVLDSGNLV